MISFFYKMREREIEFTGEIGGVLGLLARGLFMGFMVARLGVWCKGGGGAIATILSANFLNQG